MLRRTTHLVTHAHLHCCCLSRSNFFINSLRFCFVHISKLHSYNSERHSNEVNCVQTKPSNGYLDDFLLYPKNVGYAFLKYYSLQPLSLSFSLSRCLFTSWQMCWPYVFCEHREFWHFRIQNKFPIAKLNYNNFHQQLPISPYLCGITGQMYGSH